MCTTISNLCDKCQIIICIFFEIQVFWIDRMNSSPNKVLQINFRNGNFVQQEKGKQNY